MQVKVSFLFIVFLCSEHIEIYLFHCWLRGEVGEEGSRGQVEEGNVEEAGEEERRKKGGGGGGRRGRGDEEWRR